MKYTLPLALLSVAAFALYLGLAQRTPETGGGLAATALEIRDEPRATPTTDAAEPMTLVQREKPRPEASGTPPSFFGVRVRIVDAEGRPLAGVPVALISSAGASAIEREHEALARELGISRELLSPHWFRGQGRVFARGAVVASALTTADAGEAWFPLSQDSPHELRAACATLRGEPASAVAPAEPATLIELRLPRSPWLEIEVRGRDCWELDLEQANAAASGDHGPANLHVLAQPFVLNAPMKLLVPYAAGDEPRCTAWIEAPLAPRLVLEPEPTPHGGKIELNAAQLLCQARLRLLRLDGEPWCDTSLQLRLIGEPFRSAERVRSDLEGYVRFFLRAGPIAHGARGLSVTCPIDRGPNSHPVKRYRAAHPDEAEAHLELSRSFAAGEEHDLGSLRQGDGPVLLSGFVVDQEGRPLARAKVSYDGHEIACDANGRFQRRGIAEAHEVLVEASAPHFGQRDPLRIQLPAQDLQLMLEPNGSLRIRFEVPEGLASDTLQVEPERRLREGTEVRWKPQPKARMHGAERHFVCEDLVPGTYRFSIQRGRIVLHRFELEIGSGTRDLGTIDLRELVQPLRFRLVPALGQRESLTLQLFSGADVEAAIEVMPKSLGTIDLWIPERCDRWVLLADGQRHDGRCDQPMPIDLR